jgi:hypothetical protein
MEANFVSLLTRSGFVLLSAGTLWTLSTSAIAGGYLVHGGPSPLRFAKAAPRVDPAVVLPPLKMNDESTNTNAVATVQTEIDETDPEAGPETNATQPIYGPEPGADHSDTDTNTVPVSSQVTPQMLLRFFNPGHDKEANAREPLQFTPPPPPIVAPHGSSASYVSH